MKFIRKKTTRGRNYYYFEYALKILGRRKPISVYLGSELPGNLAEVVQHNFEYIAKLANDTITAKEKEYFVPKSTLPIENARFWYQSLHHELLENDLELFRSLFSILFILNSNRSEGSDVIRKDIEKLVQRKHKPKTIMDLEVRNSLAALRFAFSSQMKWTVKSLTTLHRLLFDKLVPEIAGKLKRENVIVNNEQTTDWKLVKKELQSLLQWFSKNKKKYYPPILALTFHYRFEKIHPFVDGNGRIGRLLFNAFLLQQGYMPTIFFSENHTAYSSGISKALQGHTKKLATYYIDQVAKTRKAVQKYKQEGIIKGGSLQVGRWEIEHGKIRKY